MGVRDRSNHSVQGALSCLVLAVLAACGDGDAVAGGTGTSETTLSESSTGGTSGEDAFAAVLDRLVAPHLDPSGTTGAIGLVAAVVGPGVRVVAGYGATRLGGPAPGPDTIFEIGSLTKVFSGLLLARAIDRGTVALADPIDPAFPLGAPQFAGQSITLQDLATHSSGLPRMPNNTHSADPQNPGAGYSEQDLAEFMASWTLKAAPGTTLMYSNLGAGALGYILVEDAGEASYEALVRRDLAEPLGMVDTRIAIPAADQARVARGYWQGIAAPANEIGEPLAGGGALRSSGADMLRLVEAALGVGDPAVVAAWSRAIEAQRPSPQGEEGQLGLLVARETVDGRYLYFKDGQTAGFSSYLLFSPSPPAAVVLLANAGDLAESDALKVLAREVLDALAL